MKPPTLGERLRYRFDNTLTRGAAAQIAWLGLVTLGVIVGAALLLSLAGIAPADGEGLSFPEAAWMSLMRTLDPGTMGGDLGWGFRLVMLGVTFGGIFILSTLIGVITSGLETQLATLRKGRSRVVERNHTVILGWNEQVFTIVSELVQANANQARAAVVVLAEQDKVAMEDSLRERIGPTGPTRLVCRTGSPMDMADLNLVGVPQSRSVIVLSPQGENPDVDVIKALLAITNDPGRRPEPYHIVAEIREPQNRAVASMAGRDEVEVVLAGELIARMIAQTCRQSGLSVVYNELLDFGGDEIYFQEAPSLAGKPFGETLSAYEDSTVIGLARPGLAPSLQPPFDTILQPGDRLIFIAADDDTIHLSEQPPPAVVEQAIRRGEPGPPRPEATLVLGWNWRGPAVVGELDPYVAAGSRVTVIAPPPQDDTAVRQTASRLRNQSLEVRIDDASDRTVLEGLRLDRFDHVIVLADDRLGVQRADARTLVTLLHLRELADRSAARPSIVSEMLDLRNRRLADVTRADDFIVSDRLVSLLLAQISENKALAAIFEDLFNPEGSEVYLKPASRYVEPGRPVDFYTVLESARRQGEIAIGYRRVALAGDPTRAYGVVVNPRKSERLEFAQGDRVIVLAES